MLIFDVTIMTSWRHFFWSTLKRFCRQIKSRKSHRRNFFNLLPFKSYRQKSKSLVISPLYPIRVKLNSRLFETGFIAWISLIPLAYPRNSAKRIPSSWWWTLQKFHPIGSWWWTLQKSTRMMILSFIVCCHLCLPWVSGDTFSASFPQTIPFFEPHFRSSLLFQIEYV